MTDNSRRDANPRGADSPYAPAPYGVDPLPDDRIGEAHLLDYARVLYKRRWTALSVLLLVLGTVTAYVFSVKPLYESRVQLLIEAENPNVISFKQVIEQDKTTTDYYQTQYKILQSRSLAQRTLDALNLWNHHEFTSEAGWTRRPYEWGRRLFGDPFERAWTAVAAFFPSPRADEQRASDATAATQVETAAQSLAIDAFLERLIVLPVRNSRLVDARFASTDPALAALVVNTLARVYIDQTLAFKFLASKEASDWLGQQLAEQRKQMEASEMALQQYRERGGDAVALEDRENIVVQRLADLNAAVTKARAERIQKETFYNRVRTVQNDRTALDTIPAILSNTFIQQLKGDLAQRQSQQAQLAENLGEKHPDMLKMRSAIQTTETKLQAEIAKVVEAIENDYLAALAHERSLSMSLDAQKGEVLQLSRKGIGYGVLRRESETNRQVYESLLQRAKETGIAGELKTSNIRVVDAAEMPRRPARPNKTLALVAALFGGIALAVGAAFSAEYLDDRIKSPAEIRSILHLPLLGLVPALTTKQIKAGASLLNTPVPPNFTEALMNVRTGVLFSSAEDGPKSLVITSAVPREGKTLMACNLAMALAQSGQRVLLIDADLRRPRVHELFELERDPGLSNLLVNAVEAGRVIRESDIPGLWLIPSGPQPPRPADLFGSQRFKDFLTSLGDYFDWIIIDSPPVMAVTDAAVISHAASGVVFVVGCEMTSRHAARAALESLGDTAKAKVFGAILNRVRLSRNAYYYSAYYRRDYKAYQQAPDEQVPSADHASLGLRTNSATG